MAEPAFSINFTARFAASERCARGDAIVYDSNAGLWKVATEAVRMALGKRAEAIALTYKGGSRVGSVSYQMTGVLADEVGDLGAGLEQWVRVSTDGRLERIATPDSGDDLVGKAAVDGRVALDMGKWDSGNIAGGGATPGGTVGQLQENDGAGGLAGKAHGTVGGVLRQTGATTSAFGPLNLESANARTGVLPGSSVAPDFVAQDVKTTGRVALGTSSLTAMQANGATLNIGQDNAGGTQFSQVQVFPTSNVNMGVGATSYLTLGSGVVNAKVPITCGTGTVATTGDMRLSSTGVIAFDRGGFNILGLYMSTGTSLGVGDANATALTLMSGGNITLSPTATGQTGFTTKQFLANVTAPASNPVNGGFLYAEGGAGKWRGSSGTVTPFGPAEPHCPRCGTDVGIQGAENDIFGEEFIVCRSCEVRTGNGLVVHVTDFFERNKS